MKKHINIIINLTFFTAVVLVACIIATLGLAKKINQNHLQYNQGLTGTVIKQSIPILALSRGIIKKIYVRPGEEVKKNELLVELDNPLLAGKIEALQTYQDNVSAQTEAKVAEEEMKGWKIYSPVNGVVTDLFITEGSPVEDLAKVLNIYSNENILLLANLDNDQYAAVQQLHETSAYSKRLNQNFTIQPDILQPDEKVDNLNEKKIGLYFTFKDKSEAQSLLNNEDLDLNIGQSTNNILKPTDYIVNFWNQIFKSLKK